MHVRRLSAEGIGGEGPRHLPRIPQHEIGERVAGPGGACRVLGDRSVEGPLPLVLFAVGEERHPAADLAAELQDVARLDPRDVVAEFIDLEVLRLRALIERRSVHRRVAAPAEIRKGPADAGPRGLLEPGHARLPVEVRSLQKRLEVDGRRHVVEADLVEQGLRERVRHRDDDVVPAGAQRGAAERGERVGIVHPLIVKAVPGEEPVPIAKRLVDPGRELIHVQAADGRPCKRPGRRVRVRNEPREVERLRRQSPGGNRVVGKRLARRRIVDPVRDRPEVAGLHGRRGDDAVEDQALLLTHAFVAGEEERAAPEDRPAERPAELMALQLLGLAREEVARIKGIVAQELERRAVELIGARLRRRVQHASGLAELGRVRALLDLEFL